jgi:transposase
LTCRDALSSEPLSGVVFVFRNRRATAIKILAYDGQGFWLCQKRLSQSRFGHWPRAAGSVKRELMAHELQVLLSGGNPETTGAAPQWRQIVPAAAEAGA